MSDNTESAPDDVLERRWRLTPILAVVALVATLLMGHTLRTHIGLEFSPAAIRTWVTDLGWKGSAGFIALVTFRQFLLLPAFLLLTVGGLAFGAAVGAVLGGAGIFLSAALAFAVARMVGRGWLTPGAFFATKTPSPEACLPEPVPSTCGNGTFEADACEQCDDGGNVPLDGCAANCRLEQATVGTNTTASAYQQAFGSDGQFQTMLGVAESLGMSTELLGVVAASEGNEITGYTAALEGQDNDEALLISRADLPVDVLTSLVHPVGNREVRIEVPVGIFRLTYPSPNFGGTPTLDFLTPDGVLVPPPTGGQSATMSGGMCEAAWQETMECYAASRTPVRVAACASFAIAATTCAANKGWHPSCAQAAALSVPCLWTECPSAFGAACVTSSCHEGYCAFPRSGPPCVANMPLVPRCDRAAHETCNPDTGQCELFEITSVSDPAISEAWRGPAGTFTPENFADVTAEYVGHPRYPVKMIVMENGSNLTTNGKYWCYNCGGGNEPGRCGPWYKIFSVESHPLTFVDTPLISGCDTYDPSNPCYGGYPSRDSAKMMVILEDANQVRTARKCFRWEVQVDGTGMNCDLHECDDDYPPDSAF